MEGTTIEKGQQPRYYKVGFIGLLSSNMLMNIAKSVISVKGVVNHKKK